MSEQAPGTTLVGPISPPGYDPGQPLSQGEAAVFGSIVANYGAVAPDPFAQAGPAEVGSVATPGTEVVGPIVAEVGAPLENPQVIDAEVIESSTTELAPAVAEAASFAGPLVVAAESRPSSRGLVTQGGRGIALHRRGANPRATHAITVRPGGRLARRRGPAPIQLLDYQNNDHLSRKPYGHDAYSYIDPGTGQRVFLPGFTRAIDRPRALNPNTPRIANASTKGVPEVSRAVTAAQGVDDFRSTDRQHHHMTRRQRFGHWLYHSFGDALGGVFDRRGRNTRHLRESDLDPWTGRVRLDANHRPIKTGARQRDYVYTGPGGPRS
jgi:hypothetical protein